MNKEIGEAMKNEAGVEMVHLSGLDGIENKTRTVEAVRFRSVTGCLLALEGNEAATAAGDRGAINVWKDDAGILRAEFMRYRVTQDRLAGGTKKELREWLKVWIPRLSSEASRVA